MNRVSAHAGGGPCAVPERFFEYTVFFSDDHTVVIHAPGGAEARGWPRRFHPGTAAERIVDGWRTYGAAPAPSSGSSPAVLGRATGATLARVATGRSCPVLSVVVAAVVAGVSARGVLVALNLGPLPALAVLVLGVVVAGHERGTAHPRRGSGRVRVPSCQSGSGGHSRT